MARKAHDNLKASYTLSVCHVLGRRYHLARRRSRSWMLPRSGCEAGNCLSLISLVEIDQRSMRGSADVFAADNVTL